MNEILVIGDSCKDIHIYGKCERMCPDAPVPVFVPVCRKENLGMAGNVYQNVIALGMKATLKTNKVIIEKMRYVQEATNHMFLRVDSGEENIKRITHLTAKLLNKFDLIIISDYNKGFLLKEDIEFICNNHSNVFIDTKKKIGDYCKKANFIKINKLEYTNSIDYLKTHPWTYNKVIQTRGGEGCSIGGKTYSVENVEIKDVCGAGDTFLAALCVNYMETQNISNAIKFANECASVVVQLKGVNTIEKL